MNLRSFENDSYLYASLRIVYARKETLMNLHNFENDSYLYASHLRTVYVRHERESIVQRCINSLRCVEFDTLAFSGVSGVGIGILLAHLMNKEIIIARKPNEHHRAYFNYPNEGYRFAKKYIIVDDLVSTGTTCARVIRAVRDVSPAAELTGILLYHSGPAVLGPSEMTFQSVVATAARMDQDVKEGKPAEE